MGIMNLQEIMFSEVERWLDSAILRSNILEDK
jgi:hypothetical protein